MISALPEYPHDVLQPFRAPPFRAEGTSVVCGLRSDVEGCCRCRSSACGRGGWQGGRLAESHDRVPLRRRERHLPPGPGDPVGAGSLLARNGENGAQVPLRGNQCRTSPSRSTLAPSGMSAPDPTPWTVTRVSPLLSVMLLCSLLPCGIATAQPEGHALSDIDRFNYVIGTQTFLQLRHRHPDLQPGIPVHR